jgi:hypothetical protein
MVRAPTNNTLLTDVTAMKTALTEDWAGKTFLINDELIKIDDVTAEFEDFITEDAELLAAHRTWKQLLDKHNAKRKGTVTPRLATMRRLVISMYGPSNAKLTKYGVKPRKKTVVPLKTKTDAQAKSKATREARGTVSPKKRKAIKGTVPTPPASGAGGAGSTGATAKQRRAR